VTRGTFQILMDRENIRAVSSSGFFIFKPRPNFVWIRSNFVWIRSNFVSRRPNLFLKRPNLFLKRSNYAWKRSNFGWIRPNLFEKDRSLFFMVFLNIFRTFFRTILLFLKRLLQECSCHLILICLVFPLNNDTFYPDIL
jgi:hypothetical protein